MSNAANMSNAAKHCEDLVRDADKDRFLATLFAPAQTRADLFALYAFDIETAAVAHRVRDPMAGEIRFQWWHDVFSGKSDASGHPVATAFLAAVSRHQVPIVLAIALIDARRDALYAEDGEAAFELQASETHGSIYEIAARMLTHQRSEAIRLASHHAGVATAAAYSDRQDRADIVRRHVEAVRALIATLPQQALPAFLPLALAARVVDQPQLPQWRKQWILWRASRNLAGWL
jgi:phytoene synthase